MKKLLNVVKTLLLEPKNTFGAKKQHNLLKNDDRSDFESWTKRNDSPPKKKKKNTQILEDNIFQFNFKQQITLMKYIQRAQISSLCFKQY